MQHLYLIAYRFAAIFAFLSLSLSLSPLYDKKYAELEGQQRVVEMDSLISGKRLRYLDTDSDVLKVQIRDRSRSLPESIDYYLRTVKVNFRYFFPFLSSKIMEDVCMYIQQIRFKCTTARNEVKTRAKEGEGWRRLTDLSKLSKKEFVYERVF